MRYDGARTSLDRHANHADAITPVTSNASENRLACPTCWATFFLSVWGPVSVVHRERGGLVAAARVFVSCATTP
jgi:hypothetical protein